MMKTWFQPIILFIVVLQSASGFLAVLAMSVQVCFSVIKSKLRTWSPERPSRIQSPCLEADSTLLLLILIVNKPLFYE